MMIEVHATGDGHHPDGGDKPHGAFPPPPRATGQPFKQQHHSTDDHHHHHQRPSNRAGVLRSYCSHRYAVFALCILATVLGLVAWLVLLHLRLQSQQAETRSLRMVVETVQNALELVASEQPPLSDRIQKLKLATETNQRTLESSLDAKISGAKSQLSGFQVEIAKLKTIVEEHSLHQRVEIMEGQIEMFRRMFGLAPGGGGIPPLPNGVPQESIGGGDYTPGGLPGRHNPPNEPPTDAVQQQHPPEYHGDKAEDLPDDTRDLPDNERNRQRSEQVKEEFIASWNGYRKYAWGHDELCPNSMRHKDWGGPHSRGLALTAVDALSTLWIMGLRQEFDEAVRLVTEFVDYDQDISVSVFETTIRVVAGLLSAYELSGESNDALLGSAVYVMDKLLHAFNTTTAIPHQTVNLKTHEHWNPDWSNGASILSEFGSLQLELRTLSFHTANPIYDMKATHLSKILEARCLESVCPTLFDIATGEVRSDHITLGALGDSYYEYLLKQYLLTDKAEPKYRDATVAALDALRVRLFRYSSPSHQGYFGEFVDGAFDYKMDHLACFASGMYALAAMHNVGDDGRVQAYRKVAADVADTCYQMYDSQASGIAPEIVDFAGGQDFRAGEAYYLLRPEAVESIFYMWRLTKDEKYRTYQWKIFQHLKKYCKSEVTGAYSGVSMVSVVPPEQDDLMQSFWLAETLKYIYLTFVPDDVLDLEQWVFNTEAHPLKIRRRDPLDVWREWEAAHEGQLPWLPPTVDGVGIVETQKMMQDRLSDGSNTRRVAPIDPLGSDMRSVEDTGFVDPDSKIPYDPNDDPFARTRPQRHDVKWKKARRLSQALRPDLSRGLSPPS